MSEPVTLEIPDQTAQRDRQVAARTRRRLEDVLVEWIDQAVIGPPVGSLPDDQVLALCDLQMEAAQQEELADLLASRREGQLSEAERARLDEIMHLYRHGLVRKAHIVDPFVKTRKRLIEATDQNGPPLVFCSRETDEVSPGCKNS